MQVPKKQLIINDNKTFKAIKKPIANKILNCFYDKPLTAPQIADAIKFPKDKIHYHIKKLISLKIININGSEMVMGIEQKKFYPSAYKIIFNEDTIFNFNKYLKKEQKSNINEEAKQIKKSIIISIKIFHQKILKKKKIIKIELKKFLIINKI